MKNILPLLLLIISFCVKSNNGYSQHGHDSNDPLHDVRRCATMEADSLLRSRLPQLGTLNDFENDLQKKIIEIEKRNKSAKITAEVLTIPIVVHVVHNGEAVGQGTNISAAQVQSQIDVLNEDFRRKPNTRGFNNNPVGADIEIEFCLAVLDPQGRTIAERGIHRYNGRKAEWQQDEVESVLKPATIWDPNKYYNIWVVNFDGTSPGTTLGYAQFPTNSGLPGLGLGTASGANTDGVVILYTAFGSSDKGTFPGLGANYNKGRTLTHETGHFLGLRHIWGDGVCAEDFVADTPSADGPSTGCPVGRVSCGSVNMVQNYMDYSNDVCMNIFTQGQKTRMRAVMEVSPRRNTLLSSNVCGTLVAAAPVANFRADKQLVLRGATVNFTDISANFPNRWQWSFEGGEPSTSTQRNPSVVYNTPGKFDVTLTVSNDLGTSTITKQDYIEVSEAGLCGTITNFNGTPTLLKAPVDSITVGYVTGQNNTRHRATAEFFSNPFGYSYLGGASLRFGYAYSTREDATVTILAWNARGFQGAPGAIYERKTVLLKQIQQDIANGVPTQITFDRNIPTGGFGFHIGVELTYEGDSIALITTRNGEWNFNTSWEQDSTGTWLPYSISQGLNFAHDIIASVGMMPSVQVTSSALIINPGESVTLNARGASLFSWGPNNAGLNTILGPQVVARPEQTTTYTVTGSGVDLCRTTASVTVVVRGPVATVPEAELQQLNIYPNPNKGQFNLSLSNDITGPVSIEVFNAVGTKLFTIEDVKSKNEYEKNLDLQQLPNGVYIVTFSANNFVVRKRIIKM